MGSYFIQDISSSCLLERIIKGPHVERSVRDLEDERKQHENCSAAVNKSSLVWTWCQIFGCQLSCQVLGDIRYLDLFLRILVSLRLQILRMFACNILINIVINFFFNFQKRSLLFHSFIVVTFQIQKPMRINSFY